MTPPPTNNPFEPIIPPLMLLIAAILGNLAHRINVRRGDKKLKTLEAKAVKLERKILYIDDSEDDRDLMCYFLQTIGVEKDLIETVDSAYHAYDMLAAAPHSYLFVMCDYALTQNGMNFLERMKLNDDLASIPVVLVSGSGMNENIEMYKSGAIVFLEKRQGDFIDAAKLFKALNNSGVKIKFIR